MSAAEPTSSALPARSDYRGVSALALMVVIWGSSFLLISLSLREFNPVQVVAGRLLLGGGFLLLMVGLSGQSLRGLMEHWRWLLLISIVNYTIPFFAVAWAQQTIPSSMTAIFMSGIPLFTLLLSRIVLGEVVSARRWMGFALGFTGLLWLTGADALSQAGLSASAMPQLVLIGACVLFALSSVIIRRMPRVPALPATAVMLVVGGLILLPLGGYGAVDKAMTIIAGDVMALGPAIISLGALICLGILPTAVGQLLRTFTIQSYGPVFFSIVGYIVPVWATVIGVWVLNEQIALHQMLAFGLIVGGLLLAHDGGFGSRTAKRS